MVSVTMLTGVLAVVDWFAFLVASVDQPPSLAELREYQDSRSLFWPALAVTSILWFWKTMIAKSRVVVRLLALVFLAIGMIGLVRSVIADNPDTRDAFVIRFWDCPVSVTVLTLEAQASTCTDHSIERMQWYLIEEDDYYNVDAPTFVKPSSGEGNSATWEGLPQGRYVARLATDNDPSLSSYDMIRSVRVTTTSSWSNTANMVPGEAVRQPYWTQRVEFTPQLQSMNVYFLPIPNAEVGET